MQVTEILKTSKRTSTLRHSESRIQNPKSPLGVKGFTLVEIAVVLVIFGIIFMSVLKVESMVRNAKIRQVISQYRELRTAILIYKDKYGYLPGDDPKATVHVGARSTSNGDGNQRINISGVQEYHLLYEHLNRAGLIRGNYNTIFIDTTAGLNYPSPPLLHAFNSQVIVVYETIIAGSGIQKMEGNCVRFDNLPADAAQAIDTILDDGSYKTGSVRGSNKSDRAPHDYTFTVTGGIPFLNIFFE